MNSHLKDTTKSLTDNLALSTCTCIYAVIQSPVMRKPAFMHMRKQRRRSAACNCAADQRHCFCYIDSTIHLLPKSEIFKPLAIFCGCAAWFVSNLAGNPEDRFSHDVAHTFTLNANTKPVPSFTKLFYNMSYLML